LEAEKEPSGSRKPASVEIAKQIVVQMRQPEPSLTENLTPRVLGDMAVGPKVSQNPVDWAAATPQKTSAASTGSFQTIFTYVLR